MNKLTHNKPKCLVNLGSKTILDWHLDAIKDIDFKEIQIVVGYKKEKIKDDNLVIVENTQWQKTNMVYSMLISNKFEGDTIVSYSDIVFHKQHLIQLMKSKHDITILADLKWKDLWKLRMKYPLRDAEKFSTKNDKLQTIGGRTRSYDNIEAQYMGLLKFSKKGFYTLKKIYYELDKSKQLSIDMTSMLNLLLKKNIEIHVVYVEGKWAEADSGNDVEIYNSKLKSTLEWAHDWR